MRNMSLFQDRHTVSHSQPIVDASQDWHLLYAREDHCRTVLKMVRKLDTCDDKDFKITVCIICLKHLKLYKNITMFLEYKTLALHEQQTSP